PLCPVLDPSLSCAERQSDLVRADNLARILHALFHEFFALVKVRYEPQVASFLASDGFSRGAELHGSGFSHQAGQTLRAAHAGHDAEIDLGQADATAFIFGDEDVGRSGDYEPVANSGSVVRYYATHGCLFKPL